MVKKHTLDNQLRVLVAPNSGVHSMTALVLVGAGSRYETEKNSGISHFLEHMFFKGTKKRPNAVDISSIIDGIGGEFNAFTGKEYTGYYVKAASENMPLVLDVITDMLRNSLFKEAEIEKEKGVIIEEINMYEDMPQRKIGDIYERLLYGDHPLGWDIAGRKEIIRSITRQDFITYLDTYYHPNNMVISLAGNINDQKALQTATKYLSDLEAHNVPSYQGIKIGQEVPRLHLEYKKTDQAHLCLGLITFEQTHPKRYIGQVLNTILGSGMSSRLFIEVRERRGLAYYINSSLEGYLDTGSLVVQAGIQLKSVEEAVKVILQELNKIKIDISDAEMKKAKDYIRGKMFLELENTRNVATNYGIQEVLEGQVRTPEFIIDQVEKVTKKQVQDLAKEIFVNNRLNLAVIGPFEKPDQLEKILKL